VGEDDVVLASELGHGGHGLAGAPPLRLGRRRLAAPEQRVAAERDHEPEATTHPLDPRVHRCKTSQSQPSGTSGLSLTRQARNYGAWCYFLVIAPVPVTLVLTSFGLPS
jgi:hypothetical protein